MRAVGPAASPHSSHAKSTGSSAREEEGSVSDELLAAEEGAFLEAFFSPSRSDSLPLYFGLFTVGAAASSLELACRG